MEQKKLADITEKYKEYVDMNAKGFIIATSDYLELLSVIREQEEVENTKLLTCRDEYEALIEKLASILGCEDEWSNAHDHRECVIEKAEHLVALVEQHKRDVDEESIEAANKAVVRVKQSLIQELDTIAKDYFVSTTKS